jgi:hypothetical protein
MQEDLPTFNLDINPTIQLKLNFTAEVRENGAWKPLESTIDFKNSPELCKLIFDIMSMSKENARGLEIPEEYMAFLLNSGFLLKKAIKPNGNTFKCVISNKINPLVPINALIFPENLADYRINPYIFWQVDQNIPPQVRERLPNSDFIAGNYPVLWVEQPRTKAIIPLWFAPEQANQMAGLIKGDIAITDLPVEVVQQLVMANILLPSYFLTERFKDELEQVYRNVKQSLLTNGYVVLRDIINPLQIGALRQYYRDIEHLDYFRRDSQVPKRDIIHNEPVARFIHYQLKNLINKVSPERVIPSFTYLSIYKPGSILDKHTDREQCAWNMSVSIDMQPESEIWPIYMEIAGKAFEVRLGMGDAVLYSGTKIPHWREQLPENQKAIICFYHFVAEDFSGPLL